MTMSSERTASGCDVAISFNADFSGHFWHSTRVTRVIQYSKQIVSYILLFELLCANTILMDYVCSMKVTTVYGYEDK